MKIYGLGGVLFSEILGAPSAHEILSPNLLTAATMGYFEDIQRTMCRIPLGKVATYGDVARAAGHPGTARQVAWALHNADVRGIPWQRVLGRGGRILLPGRAGALQHELLERENVRFIGERVDMKHCAFRFSKIR